MASLGLEYLESDPDSDPEIVPESPLATPITESRSPAAPITESPLAMPTLSFTFPLPPTDRTYHTPEEGVEAINSFARPHGYAVTTRRSKFTQKGKGIKKTVFLCCDRGRKVTEQPEDPPQAKRRNTSTLALGCPFMIVLRLDLQSGIWHTTVSNSTHNHEPSPPSTHPAQRALELTHKKDKVENALR